MTKHIFTIPPDADFIGKLAEGLWKEVQGDPFKLADRMVLLPTRRACRNLREAFARVTGTQATLLPRMHPIGDLDEDELYFGESDFDIPPAISPLRRQLLLARLIRAKDAAMPLDQAAQLAEALGQFLDQVQIERKDFSGLEKLVPENLAVHWQQTLEFLKILTEAWPKLLAEEGAIDPVARRNRVLEMQAETWRKNPPDFPIIAAGSTGSMPATRDLLEVIASLPKGSIVLPGLDQEIDEEAWQKIEDTHPQFGLKQLLEQFKLARSDVKLWPACAKKSSPRVRLLQETMRPAEVTEAWRELDTKKISTTALKGLSRLTLDNAQEEAQTIALLMRGVLETPAKTAALVTADRALAQRVMQQLARWDIEANDSAGAPLTSLPVGSFLLDVLAAAAPQAGAVDYLSLLKHPLAACGLNPTLCRSRAREAELLVWRAPGPVGDDAKDIQIWLEDFKETFAPLTQNWRKHRHLNEWIDAHRILAEQLAQSDTEKGALRLWVGENGEAAADWLNDWRAAAHDFPPMNGEEYAALFAELLGKVTVRPRFGQHPRLAILGPLEARLIQFDLTILGGLNENSWPPEAGIDPWMSRPMKQEFGLPLPERRIGLSAHDFVQLASSPEVVLTRARRAGNAPTVPSRFLLQLETVLRALGYHDEHKDALAADEPWDVLARMLDEPKAITPCAPPEPRPAMPARPKSLHVTEIGTWRRNPYAIYAKHVLGLRKLEALDTDVTAADRGLIIHKVLEIFSHKYPDQLPPKALEELIKIGREAFMPYRDWPEVMAFWWPRFERIATWFIAEETERRHEGIKTLKAETVGTLTFKNDFILKGRADRIDRLADGSLAIIDYKTGGLPTQADVKAGLEPQLPLLALMAEGGGFKDVKSAKVSELAYWKLSGGAEAGFRQTIKEPIDTLAENARKGLENLITSFANENMPYRAVPKPALQPRYDDYAHLARLAEWGRTAEDA